MGDELAQPREPQPDDQREPREPDTLSIAWERMNAARAEADAAAERFR